MAKNKYAYNEESVNFAIELEKSNENTFIEVA